MAAQRARQLAQARRGLAELAGLDLAGLSASQSVSASLLRWQLDTCLARQPFLDHLFVFRQLRAEGTPAD